MTSDTDMKPKNLKQLIDSGWQSKTVKQEIRQNFLQQLANGEELYPGIVGYENTVIPEINIALLSEHDMLYLGEKGQAKSRLMREAPFHEDPLNPLSKVAKDFLANTDPDQVPIKWWHREDRYAERRIALWVDSSHASWHLCDQRTSGT